MEVQYEGHVSSTQQNNVTLDKQLSTIRQTLCHLIQPSKYIDPIKMCRFVEMFSSICRIANEMVLNQSEWHKLAAADPRACY